MFSGEGVVSGTLVQRCQCLVNGTLSGAIVNTFSKAAIASVVFPVFEWQ
ncbi:MAG: hypothetical protein Ct9H300mP1_15140 [Planctomycetaceae bacterium]|nr:MAG: hypothetical protein Ct9H300mP1_15140 [Planctomycetaceae bacterium]